MRIAEFTDSFLPIVDGVGRVVYSYASNLVAKGHECYVIAPMTKTGFRGHYDFEIVDFLSTNFQQYSVGIPLTDAHFHARMEDIDIDIIHAHSPFFAGQTALYYAKKRGIPLIGTLHSKYRDDFKQATGMNMLADVGTKIIVDFYERCDQVWAVSEYTAEILRSYGYRGNIIVMQNGVELKAAEPSDVELIEDIYHLGSLPVFLFVGQQNWKKNIERILLAAALLNDKGYDFRLILTGKGPHADKIKSKASELMLDDKVIFTGHVSDQQTIAGLYQRASLLVFPSVYDAASLVIREAALYGTAAAVIRDSGPAESVVDRKNGFICEDTTESFASAMEEVINNPAFAKELGQNAKNTIPIPWSVLVDDVVEKYEQLINSYTKLGLNKKQKGLLKADK